MKRIMFLTVAALACTAAAFALTEIKIQGFKFIPQNVLIPKGETVLWTNLDSIIHTATSNTGVWDSGDIEPNGSYKRKFNKAGTYLYNCKYHAELPGTIRVTETAVAPTSYGRVKALFR